VTLEKYHAKRKFDKTPEPSGRVARHRGGLRFVVQKHAASRLHYDFRLELDGVLKSWAVPKGPSLNPADKRLAMMVEDHPLDYADFEGIIPAGNYGAGTVMVWDRGDYQAVHSADRQESQKALAEGLAKGHVRFKLHGQKLQGGFSLVRLHQGEKNAWLLVKSRDEFADTADVERKDLSVLSGRTMQNIADTARAAGEVWLSRRRAKDLDLSGAAKAPFPRTIKPMLAKAGAKAFDKPGWIFEVMWGGYRALAEVHRRGVRLRSRSGKPFDVEFAPLISSLEKLGHEAVLDGEIVVLDAEGKSHLQLLQDYQETGAGPLVYYAFDLLYLDGHDLCRLPLRRRLELLQEIVQDLPNIHWSDHVPEHGVAFFEAARAAGLDGIMAKRADSPYRAGIRSPDWLKIKIPARQQAKETALVSAAHRKSRKPAGSATAVPQLTHVDKVYWPKEGYTKGDLLRYYDEVADFILPYLRDRPQSLHRHPNGIEAKSFFQKDMSKQTVPAGIETVVIPSGHKAKAISYLLCQDKFALLYIANLGCIELNPWNSRVGTLDRPDYLILDLDPGDLAFDHVVETAQTVRRVLDEIEVPSVCKTSGKRGLHIEVPLGAKYDYDQARQFAQIVATIVHRKLPATTSVMRSPSRRQNQVYLDCFQNARGQTLAAPYSVRPVAGAKVSTPLKWSEVKKGLNPARFTIQTVRRRLDRVGDLWQPVLGVGIDLQNSLQRLQKVQARK
jgi:bifunctional non-homologous end joining protein LigD